MQNESLKYKSKYKSFSLFAFRFSLMGGFSLVEIIIVTAIVTIALVGFLQTEVVSVKILRSERDNLEATFLAQEGLEALRSIRDESWTNNIASLANGTNYYPVVQNGKWTLTTTPPPLLNGKYTRLLVLGEVKRSVSDQISPSGTVDTGTRLATSRVTWSANKKIELAAYITNFQEPLGE